MLKQSLCQPTHDSSSEQNSGLSLIQGHVCIIAAAVPIVLRLPQELEYGYNLVGGIGSIAVFHRELP